MPLTDLEPRTEEGRRYYGKYPGIVLANDPPEGGVPHRGEVLVQVPGILEEDPSGSGERPLEVLAKPCLPPGFFFVPEPKMWVWVEFAAGDIDSALWSGVWHPDNSTPQTPDGQSPTQHQKVLRTAKGHVLLLDDTDNAEQLVLKDAKGNAFTLNAQGIKLEDANGHTLTMDANGVVLAASSGRKIQLDATAVKATDNTMSLQAIALAPVLQWLMQHTHVGNMGAPAPGNPGQLPLLMQPDKASGPPA